MFQDGHGQASTKIPVLVQLLNKLDWWRVPQHEDEINNQGDLLLYMLDVVAEKVWADVA